MRNQSINQSKEGETQSKREKVRVYLNTISVAQTLDQFHCQTFTRLRHFFSSLHRFQHQGIQKTPKIGFLFRKSFLELKSSDKTKGFKTVKGYPINY